jgi:hypothetical protein
MRRRLSGLRMVINRSPGDEDWVQGLCPEEAKGRAQALRLGLWPEEPWELSPRFSP